MKHIIFAVAAVAAYFFIASPFNLVAAIVIGAAWIASLKG